MSLILLNLLTVVCHSLKAGFELLTAESPEFVDPLRGFPYDV